ncbi:MAG: rhomboid family intramembrane serine protease [Calditrichaeota bacterium]|nr:MAG: rhomboid family intramembrane serine protease [Calditrichota bacterium]MBL1206744.1 rhomboid family intramembrane serine protease [Calditrichota bacterium]NOG46570.1 rhomboid family intramembrane serine protease [Calditrichota bacterium]
MNRFAGSGGILPPMIKNILLANAAVFILQQSILGETIKDLFMLSAYGIFVEFKIWQLASYMFLHGSFGHIFWNMFAVWIFGSQLEEEMGSKEFLKYYFITGMGAGLFFTLVVPNPTLGASGAMFGIMAAWLVKWPNREILLNFLFPIKAKYLIVFFVLVSFFSITGPSDGIAHAAHLGGFIVGYLYLRWRFLFDTVKGFFNSGVSNLSSGSPKSKMSYTRGGSGDKKDFYRKRLDELLDKINKVGYINLSEEERKMLEEASKYLEEHDKKNMH